MKISRRTITRLVLGTPVAASLAAAGPLAGLFGFGPAAAGQEVSPPAPSETPSPEPEETPP